MFGYVLTHKDNLPQHHRKISNPTKTKKAIRKREFLVSRKKHGLVHYLKHGHVCLSDSWSAADNQVLKIHKHFYCTKLEHLPFCHCRLSPVTLLCNAALGTVGQLARKIS